MVSSRANPAAVARPSVAVAARALTGRLLASVRRRVTRPLLRRAARANQFVITGPFQRYEPLDLEFLDEIDRSVGSNVVRFMTTQLLRRELNERGVPGSVAEVGVSRGDFATIINRLFPDRTLHLFDTFAGFDERDVRADAQLELPSAPYPVGPADPGLVLARLPHPERARLHTGWFPESATGLEDEVFCFVHVDVGLYHATAAALRWFMPRLSPGGYLLVADYHNAHAPGVRRALREIVVATGSAYSVLPDYAASALIAKGGTPERRFAKRGQRDEATAGPPAHEAP